MVRFARFSFHSSVSTLFLSVILTLLLVANPDPTFAQKKKKRNKATKKAVKQLVQDSKAAINALDGHVRSLNRRFINLVPTRDEILNYESYLQVERFNAEVVHLANTDELNSSLTERFKLDSEALALEYIEAYQVGLLALNDIYNDQLVNFGSPSYLDGYFIDRRAAGAGLITAVELEISQLEYYLSIYATVIEQHAGELDSIAAGSEEVMPYGFESYLEKTLADMANYRESVATISPWYDNQAFEGGTAGRSTTNFQYFLDLLDDFSLSADDIEHFGELATDYVLDPYNGDADPSSPGPDVGMISSSNAKVAITQIVIDRLRQEIQNEISNGNLEEAEVASRQLDFFLRRQFTEILETTVTPHQASQLAQIIGSAGALADPSRNPSDAWRKVTGAAKENFAVLNTLRLPMLRGFYRTLELARNEVAKLDREFPDIATRNAEAGIIANNLRAIITGGIARFNQQFQSSAGGMSDAARGISIGEVGLAEVLGILRLLTELKAVEATDDRVNNIPAEIIEIDAEIAERQALFDQSLALIVEISERQDTFGPEKDDWLTNFVEIEALLVNANYPVIYEEHLNILLQYVRSDKKLRKYANQLEQSLTMDFRNAAEAMSTATYFVTAEAKRKKKKKKKKTGKNNVRTIFGASVLTPFNASLVIDFDSRTKFAFGGEEVGRKLAVAESTIPAMPRF